MFFDGLNPSLFLAWIPNLRLDVLSYLSYSTSKNFQADFSAYSGFKNLGDAFALRVPFERVAKVIYCFGSASLFP